MIPYPFIRSLQLARARHVAWAGLSLEIAADEGHRVGLAWEAAFPGRDAHR